MFRALSVCVCGKGLKRGFCSSAKVMHYFAVPASEYDAFHFFFFYHCGIFVCVLLVLIGFYVCVFVYSVCVSKEQHEGLGSVSSEKQKVLHLLYPITNRHDFSLCEY